MLLVAWFALFADTAGVVHNQAEWANRKAVVLIFIATDCPVSNVYTPEMNRIRRDYADRGVAVYAVHSDPSEDPAAVRRHASEFGYAFPVLLDPKQLLPKQTGARVTPEAAILSPQGKVLYLGRIDNRVEDFGKKRLEPTQHDLRDALDTVLAGKAIPNPKTRAIGCAIPTP